jgi:hypothetical protein
MTKKDNDCKCYVGGLEATNDILKKIKPSDDFRIIIIEKNNGGCITY